MSSYKKRYEALLATYIFEENPIEEVSAFIEKMNRVGADVSYLLQKIQLCKDEDIRLVFGYELRSLRQVRESIVNGLVQNPCISKGIMAGDEALKDLVEDFEAINYSIVSKEMKIKQDLLRSQMALA